LNCSHLFLFDLDQGGIVHVFDSKIALADVNFSKATNMVSLFIIMLLLSYSFVRLQHMHATLCFHSLSVNRVIPRVISSLSMML
jgi:hypothetical protein